MLLSPSKFQYFILPVLLLQLLFFFIGHVEYFSFVNTLYTALLTLALVINTKLRGRFHKRVFSGLIVTIVGMLYFSFVQERNSGLFFSMLFFVLPQIFYINAFYLDFKSAPELDKTGARLAIALAFVISIAYYLLLRGTLGILKIPVMTGIFTTNLMFMMAAFRNMRVNKGSFILVLGGVICYMFAEGIFAYHSFAHPILRMELVYSISFVAGLHLIVLGAISRKLIHTT
jgi:uncharacterized membrane protein YhhN